MERKESKLYEFFRPTKKRILTFIVLVVLSYVIGHSLPDNIFRSFKEGESLYEYKSGLPLPSLYYAGNCVSPPPGGDLIICDPDYKIRTINTLVNFAILYVISCLMLLMYSKTKLEK